MMEEMDESGFRPSIMYPTAEKFEASERDRDRNLLRRMAEQVAEVQGSVHMLDRKVVKLETRVMPRFGGLQTQIEQAIQRGMINTVVVLCCIAGYYKLSLQYPWVGWAVPAAALVHAVFTSVRDHKKALREIERQEAADAANRVT